MSISFSVSKQKTGESFDMSWIRGSLGLDMWAHLNLTHLLPFATLDLANDLTFVCKTWSYDQADEIDRKLFKQVVDSYWRFIQRMEVGYFWMDDHRYQMYAKDAYFHLPPQWQAIPDIIPHRVEMGFFGVPMDYFAHHCSEYGAVRRYSLARYQEWFSELVNIAGLLQDPAWTWYCSV